MCSGSDGGCMARQLSFQKHKQKRRPRKSGERETYM
jgi:hypothetical protein